MDDSKLFISNDLQIPHSELVYRFARSGGPGGQHVNRSETQVELVWDVASSPSLNENQRRRLLAALATRIDKDGALHLRSSETRSQEQNRRAVTARFVQLLQQALQPRRRRRKTRIPRAERRRRLERKRRRGEIKKLRGRVEKDW